jgi:hypothetical protein
LYFEDVYVVQGFPLHEIRTRNVFKVMEGISSLQIDFSPVPTIVKNKSYGSKHGWGTRKGLSRFIFLGPPHLNMLLKLSNTFILKVSFYS